MPARSNIFAPSVTNVTTPYGHTSNLCTYSNTSLFKCLEPLHLDEDLMTEAMYRKDIKLSEKFENYDDVDLEFVSKFESEAEIVVNTGKILVNNNVRNTIRNKFQSNPNAISREIIPDHLFRIEESTFQTPPSTHLIPRSVTEIKEFHGPCRENVPCI